MFFRCLLLVWGGGIISSLASRPGSMEWYDTLTKPALTPPGWVFPLAWTALYIFISISLWRVARLPFTQPGRSTALAVFAIQWLLNVLFSPVFFADQNPLGGLIITLCLFLSILLTGFHFHRLDRTAALLLTPYALWTAFATWLAAGIWWLN